MPLQVLIGLLALVALVILGAIYIGKWRTTVIRLLNEPIEHDPEQTRRLLP